jgi:two-component system, LytTR family, sensor kinase
MIDRKRFKRILIVFIVISLIGLLLSVQEHMLSVDSKEKDNVVMTWAEALIYNLGWIYLWGLASPLILKLGSRYPLTRKHLLRNIGIHAAAATIFTVVLILCLKGALWMFVKMPSNYKMDNTILAFLWRTLADDYIIGLLFYCIILGIGQVLLFYKKYRERRLRASQLETRLAETELEGLKMQLHPAYLFNTLRSISRLIHEDIDSADKMIARLGDFLRFTLDTAGSREVTLQQEIDYLKCYLEIERIRMKNRLNIELVTQPETLDWLVPALVLQPIVESVFQFSTIKGAPEQTLLVETWVDGRSKESIGIKLKGKQYTENEWSENQELLDARRRLQRIYGTAYRLDLRRDQTGNLEIQFHLPLLPNPLEKTG